MNRFLAFILSSFLLMACQSHEPVFKTLDGQVLRQADFRGRWVFFNYFASWCEPCRREIPTLNAFYAAHASTAIVLAVNFDQLPPKQLQAVVKELGIQFPVLLMDPATVLHFNLPSTLPTTYVISPQGQLQSPLLGEQTQATLTKIIH